MKISIRQILGIFIFALLVQTSYAQKQENRQVGNFTEISVGGSYNVFIKKGESISVRLEGTEKELAKVVTEVKEGKLKVYREKGKWGGSWGSSKSVNVYITYTELEGLYSSGSSNIKVENTVEANDFALGCSGSGDIQVDLKAKKLSARISGSGDLEVSGTCDEESFAVSGSGDIHASNLEAKTATLRISGSGSMRVHVTEYLEGRISGSGRVRYKGNPRQSVKISGSGSVKQE